MRYPRNALILDASTRREQVLKQENAILETCKDSRLCCCCFWLLSDGADSALIRTGRTRQASAQNATRSDVNCISNAGLAYNSKLAYEMLKAILYACRQGDGTVLKVTDEPLMFAPGKSNIHAL